MRVLPKKFYKRNPEDVAKDLLGKVLVKRHGNILLKGIIVETEAYFDKNDPASRASFSPGWERKLKREPGTSFVYMVHGHWLFNIIAHESSAGAVLIRAVEPLKGVDDKPTNGPGKFTKAFGITGRDDGKKVYVRESIWIEESKIKDFEIGTRKRIGVRADLDKDLCFFIKGNKFVSRI